MFIRGASQSLPSTDGSWECLGMGSFDRGQGTSVCEHEEEQLDWGVIDPQCAEPKPQHLWEICNVQQQRKKKC